MKTKTPVLELRDRSGRVLCRIPEGHPSYVVVILTTVNGRPAHVLNRTGLDDWPFGWVN